MKEKIDKKYLAGLKYRDSVPHVEYTPRERDLTPDDVLDWLDKGDCVVVVTADGQKYTVPKQSREEE